jgi:hypothetical protein
VTLPLSLQKSSLRLDLPAFTLGFKVVMPLWLAAIPFALAYSVSAREAGLTPVETQVMSLTVYSAAGQMAVVQLLSTGAPAFTILLTTLMMNLHHILYGLSLAKRIEMSRRAHHRCLSAHRHRLRSQHYVRREFLFSVWRGTEHLPGVESVYSLSPAAESTHTCPATARLRRTADLFRPAHFIYQDAARFCGSAGFRRCYSGVPRHAAWRGHRAHRRCHGRAGG